MFWRKGRFFMRHLWIQRGTAGKVFPRGQSGVPSTVWKEKERKKGIIPFFLFLRRVLFLELSIWNNPRSRFFSFISCDCIYCTWIVTAGLYPHCSPQLDIFDNSQWNWRILTIEHKQWISERLRVEVWAEMMLHGGLILRSSVCFWLCSGLVFPPECSLLLPSGCCCECLWSSRGYFFSTPLSSSTPKQMLSFTSDKHIMDSSIQLHMCINDPVSSLQDSSDLPQQLRQLHTWDTRLMGLISRLILGQKDATKTKWMQNEPASSKLRKSRREYSEDHSTCHQAAAVHPDGSQPRSPWSEYFLCFLLCLPPLAFSLQHRDDESIPECSGCLSPQHRPPPRACGHPEMHRNFWE